MRLADADYRAQVALQSAPLEAARAAATRPAGRPSRRSGTSRATTRWRARGSISAELVDQVQSRRDAAGAACEAARARVRQAEAALALARAQLEKTVLRAPFDGVVAEVTTEVGEWITPSPPGVPIPPVIELIDARGRSTSARRWTRWTSARSASGSRCGSRSTPTRAERSRARSSRVAPYVLDVQEQNRTFEIEAELDDAAFAREPRARDLGRRRGHPRAQGRRPAGPELGAPGGRTACWSCASGRLVEPAGDDRPAELGVRRGHRRACRPGDRRTVSLDRAEVKEGARVAITAGIDAVIELSERRARSTRSADEPVHALRGVDLTIAAGEYVAIMGPSGSGKSTLLNILGCLDRPTAGSYLLDGRESARLADDRLSEIRRHQIGFVFQSTTSCRG